ncbi:MAG: phage minor capsid protein, partial [Ruminococcus sp.]|nr:phage minor capsid protein [Ruminococcus sp.]
MLSPEYYEVCADDVVRLYQQLEDDIISEIVSRIMKSGKVTETARHQIEQLQKSGRLYDDILNTIASKTDATVQHVKALFEDAGVETVRFDNIIYRENGLTPVDIRQSPAMRQTLEAGYRKTLGNMKNLTLTTANTSQTAYINACNQAYMQITSGAFSYQEAIRQAVQRTAQDGVKVLYPSGYTERIDVAVRRAVLTGVGQTCREIGLMNAQECGCDLMEISAHSGARPAHAQWQGKIVSLSGRKGYLSKSDIGYGTGDGFGGWNCRHDWFPFFEDYSKPNYSKRQLEQLDEKNIEYNGKLYNQYEISQIQRRYEREIRSAKREQVAFKLAVEETDDPELLQVMQDSLNYAKSLVRDRQKKMRDFINQTGQDRDYFREQNYQKENVQKDLTFLLNSGKISDIKSGVYVKTKYYNCELQYYAITDERISKI